MSDENIQRRPPIDAGIPSSRENWPDGVLDRLTNFVQGDIIRDPPFFYFAHPGAAIWAPSRHLDGDPEIVELSDHDCPAYGMITTQTCDLVEEDSPRPLRPWVQIVPVENRIDLNSGQRKQLMRGKGSLYSIYIPGLPHGFWVADLRIEIPVEKGWLAQQEPIKGFTSEREQALIGERISWCRQRPAFGSIFVESVQKPLREDLRALAKEDADFFEAINTQVEEVAVALDSHLNPRDAMVTLITTEDVDDAVRAWWQNWWDRSHELAAEAGLTLHPLQFRAEGELTLSEYRRMTRVPLHLISPS